MVSTTSHVDNASDFTTISQDEYSVTSLNMTYSNQDEVSESRILLDYVILPLSTIITLILLVVAIGFLIRKRR